MWNLGNRDIIVLVSVISGWALLYNIFGPFIAIVVTFFFIVACAAFTYIVADETLPLFASQALLLALDYIERAFNEFKHSLAGAYRRFVTNIASVCRRVVHLCRIHFYERIMAQSRRSAYQLSSESIHHHHRASLKTSSSCNLVDGLSPIPRNNHFRPVGSSSNVENTPCDDARSRILQRANSYDHVTSTPLLSWKNDESRNGDVLFSGNRDVRDEKNSWKNSQSFSQNHTLFRGGESSYSHEGSPWGTSISPKMRSRAAGVKTVQTVAGPLLASTRYNIDPKVYSDVTSPGLTTRLTKYATEASTKLTHQSQYGTGQFPRVNLNSSPTPLINARTGKARTPVTVRIAPPENTRYAGPLRQQALSNVCQAESETRQQSVVQVLREISLKRHASREDVTFELAKKQRTEGAFGDGLENLEEMTQKRSRDDSSRSEEEVSPRSKLARPSKRSKMPSCHDILSSLSSSIGVSSGIKRKAIDVSRSGTPDIGKHFKSLDSAHGDAGANRRSLSRAVTEPARANERPSGEAEEFKVSPRTNHKSTYKSYAETLPFGKEALNVAEEPRDENETPKRDSRENNEKITSNSVKLTDKLFMKAEPENIDKIKTLIEEHGSTKPRFTTDDTEEIKKSDIVMMRQTSMKNRLKSMFDAISGKATSAINPEVVIQAEDKSPSSSSSPDAISVVSLTSTTSTTSVNTSPIATSAIVPIIGKTKTATTPAKHVTFQFAGKETAPRLNYTEGPKVPTNDTMIGGNIEIPETKKSDDTTLAERKTSPESIFANSPSSTSQTTPLGVKPVASAAFSIATTATPQFNARMFDSTAKSSTLAAPTTSASKSLSECSILTTQLVEKNPPSAVNFSFGAAKTEGSVATSVGQTTSKCSSSAPPATSAVVSSGIFSFGTAVRSNASAFLDNSTIAKAPGHQNVANANSPFGSSLAAVSTAPQCVVAGTTTSVQPASTTSFNALATSSASASIFGSANTSIVSSSSGFLSAGGAVSAPSFTFGTNSTVASASKPPPSFTFGSANATTAPTAAITPSLSFGSNASSVGAAPTISSTSTARSSIFGAPVVSPTTTRPSMFGTATTTTSAAGFPGNSLVSAFGTSGAQSSAFATTTSAGTTFETSKTMETSSFGVNNTVPSTSSSLFGGINAVGTSDKNSGKSPSFADNSFNKMSAIVGFNSNAERTSFAFGSQSINTSVLPSGTAFSTGTTPNFGVTTSAAAPPAFGAASFGTTTTAAPMFGSSAPSAFGASLTSQNPSSASFNAPTVGFGAAAAATTTTTTTSPTATTAPPAFPTSSSVSTGAFGNSSITGGFGASSNFNSTSTTTSTPGFAGFGAFANSPVTFGAQTPSKNAIFGSSSVANNNNNSGSANTGFTFGASKPNMQQQQQQQLQQNAVFTFGGGAATLASNPSAGGSAPFQFNATTPQTGGFNFTGAPATPAINFSKDAATSGGSFALPTGAGANSFGVPPTSGGMFSIGTGSTTPRSRASRRRQR